MRHMVVHAEHYDGALVQVTRILSADESEFSREEQCMFHAKRGCCLATIILCLLEVKSKEREKMWNEDNSIIAKRKAKMEAKEMEGQDERICKKCDEVEKKM